MYKAERVKGIVLLKGDKRIEKKNKRDFSCVDRVDESQVLLERTSGLEVLLRGWVVRTLQVSLRVYISRTWQ
jgi:hypothetical protein